MVLTPGSDISSMMMMFVPLTGLYFLGIALCKYMPGGTIRSPLRDRAHEATRRTPRAERRVITQPRALPGGTAGPRQPLPSDLVIQLRPQLVGHLAAHPQVRLFQSTVVCGATLEVSHTLEPITESCPTTVRPPRIVALA